MEREEPPFGTCGAANCRCFSVQTFCTYSDGVGVCVPVSDLNRVPQSTIRKSRNVYDTPFHRLKF